MSQGASFIPWLGEVRIGGAGRLIVGFVIGALFAVLPMYYFIGKEAALRGADAAHDQPLAATVGGARGGAEPVGTVRTGSKPFASRMTYELSQLPQDRPPPPARAAVPAVAVVSAPVTRAPATPSVPPVAVAAPQQPPLSERVVNARPIIASPPEARDRTGEIEKESQKAEYREAPRQQAKASPAAGPARVIEGRDVELKPPPKLPDTPTRAIAANAGVNTRAEIEAERGARADSSASRTAVAPDPGKKSADARASAASAQPAGPATPIKPPAKAGASESVVIAKAPASSAAIPADRDAAPVGATGAASRDGGVESRLEVTREWLAAAPAETHTIQLMGTNSEEQLRAHLKSLAKVVEPGKLYIFRTKAQGKPSITVVYGAYADRKSALQALEKLPAALVANKPVLRTVNGIRAEMKQHNPGS